MSRKSQRILNRLERLGKNQGKLCKILEKSGNFRQMLFIILVTFKWTVLFAKMNKFSIKKY